MVSNSTQPPASWELFGRSGSSQLEKREKNASARVTLALGLPFLVKFIGNGYCNGLQIKRIGCKP